MPANEVQILVSADTQNLKAQLAGARQEIEASVGSGGTLGTAVQQTGVILDQFGRQASESVGAVTVSGKVLASTLTGEVVPAEEEADQEGAKFHTELGHGARLIGNVVDSLTGGLVPGLSQAASHLSMVSRETSGLGLAAAAGAGGLLALGLVVGHYLESAKRITETQLAANKALRELDVSAAQAGLEQAADAWNQYRDTVDKALNASGTWMQNFAAQFQLMTMIPDEARAKFVAFGEAAAQSFEFFGRQQGSLQATRAELDASAKAFGLLADQAPNAAALADALEQQAQATRDAAIASVQLAQNEDDRYARAQRSIIQALSDAGEKDLAAKRSDQLDEEMGARARERIAALSAADTAYAQSRIANAQRAAEGTAQQFENEGRLAQIKGQAEQAAIAAAGAEVNARLAAATADAQYYGTATANLTTYQAQRRALIVAGANEELANIERVYQADRQAQLARIGGLQAGSGPHREALAQLERMDVTNAANRQKIQDDLRVKLIQNDAQVVQEHRANVDRMKALDQELLASGRAAADAAIGSLKEQGAQWGTITQVEARAAEQQEQAQQVLSAYLRREVVDLDAVAAAFRQADMAARNAAQGGTGWGSRIALDAQAALNALRGITPEAGDVAAALGVVGSKGAEMAREMAASVGVPIRAFSQLDVETLKMVTTFSNAGQEAGSGFASGIAAGAQQIPAALSADATGLRAGVIATFTDVGQAAGASLSSGIAAGLGQTAWVGRFDEAFSGILAAVDRFYEAFNARIASGTSRVGDTIYQGFINRVIARLDDERGRA